MVKGSAIGLSADCPMHKPDEVLENIIQGVIYIRRRPTGCVSYCGLRGGGGIPIGYIDEAGIGSEMCMKRISDGSRKQSVWV